MTRFCGQDACRIDQNGRVKLTPRLMEDFQKTSLDVMLHCLTEGAMAVYPQTVWSQMRDHEPRPAEKAAKSVVFRRELRRFGAYSQPQSISKQGRITVPQLFRDMLELTPGESVVLVGIEIGIEIWNEERWALETRKILAHQMERADAEMNSDLQTFQQEGVES
jgi:DNA-binding transcriptional regulator/RsmH inhibitor MraZ